MSPINKKLFENSVRHVRKELRKLRFGKKIVETKVYRTLLPSITKKGYFINSGDGEIFIPVLQSKRGVRDILRHEYGHALLYNYPKIRTRKGFTYFALTPNPDDYISYYAHAIEDQDEDFCETVMAYIKHRGVIPRLGSPRLRKKWRFIASLTGRKR